MDTLQNVFMGFSVALEPSNLFFCFLGAVLGTLVGVLPGIGPIGTMAIILPLTYHMPPIASLVMMAGIYFGSQYGGTITSILVNIPGDASSIVTCLDGHQMAKQGKAGPALGIAAFGSFIAGTIGLVGLMFFAKPLAKFGLKFGPPEYFALMLFGITLIAYLTQGSVLKAYMMATFGFILSCIGMDKISSVARLDFGTIYLLDGIDLVPLAVGIFGIAEMISSVEKEVHLEILTKKIENIYPSAQDWMESKWALIRGTVIGFILGLLPGGGPILASFVTYGIEKRMSKHPERFGRGAIEGVAAPESANNSACSGAFIPFLTLGIPPTPSMAMLYGVLLIQGMAPGPLFITEHPDIFWGLISSMYIGNVMLLILNLPLIPLWVKVLKVPYHILFPIILLCCIIGSYSVRSSVLDVAVMMLFGIMGYFFKKFGYEPAPLLLAYILGPLVEKNLGQSLLMSQGSFGIFFSRPISAVGTIGAIVFFIVSVYLLLSQKRIRVECTSEN